MIMIFLSLFIVCSYNIDVIFIIISNVFIVMIRISFLMLLEGLNLLGWFILYVLMTGFNCY